MILRMLLFLSNGLDDWNGSPRSLQGCVDPLLLEVVLGVHVYWDTEVARRRAGAIDVGEARR